MPTFEIPQIALKKEKLKPSGIETMFSLMYSTIDLIESFKILSMHQIGTTCHSCHPLTNFVHILQSFTHANYAHVLFVTHTEISFSFTYV